MLMLALTGESAAARKKRKKTVQPPAIVIPNDPEGYADNLEGEDRTADELAVDQDDEEPTDETTRVRHYVPKDGRNALVVSGGFAALMRTTTMTATDGTPPYYQGVLSPGMAIGLSLYPWRFKDGGGALRDLGFNARLLFAWMSAAVLDAPTQPVKTDLFYSIHAGIALRHVFGEKESAVAFGAEIGVAVDAMTLSPDLLLPPAAYVSPTATLLLEVPLANKYLVWATRAGVMPVTAVTVAQVQAYGARKMALGLDVSTGLRSTLFRDVLYAEGSAVLMNYWHDYAGRGGEGWLDVRGKDLVFGLTLSVGVTY